MKPLKYIGSGLATMLISIWLGSFILYSITPAHWAHFPMFMTMTISFVAGIIILAIGIVDSMV